MCGHRVRRIVIIKYGVFVISAVGEGYMGGKVENGYQIDLVGVG